MATARDEFFTSRGGIDVKILLLTVLLASVVLTSRIAEADVAPVVSEVVVPASTDAVWSAYTTREAIETWMVPNSSRYELVIGGEWRTSYDADSNLDDDTVVHNEILAFDPGRMLALRTVKPPADFPFPNAILATWSVLYLDRVDPEHTRVTMKMFGFDETPESQEMREFFEWGNAYELEKLAEYLSAQ